MDKFIVDEVIKEIRISNLYKNKLSIYLMDCEILSNTISDKKISDKLKLNVKVINHLRSEGLSDEEIHDLSNSTQNNGSSKLHK